MIEFDASVWGLAYAIVYGADDFLLLYNLLWQTEGQPPKKVSRYIYNRISRDQFLHAQEIAKEMRESCQAVNDPEDIRPVGLDYFWKRIQEVYDTDW